MTPEALCLPADPLGEALHDLRMSGVFYCRSEFLAPWGLTLPSLANCLMVHVVAKGSCWIDVPGEPVRELHVGDLALVPHGRGHRLLSEPGCPAPDLFDLPRQTVSDRYEILRHGGGGSAATVLCGAVCFDHPSARRLIEVLPALLVLEASPRLDWMQSTLRLLAAEASHLRPGGDAVITRLADILVIQALRAWMEQDAAAQVGWLAALRDRQIGQALALIHRDPTQPWTLARLARAVAMSRSAFAARFTTLVGEPVMHYVTRWRMQLAYSLLQADEMPVAALAERFGYESEAAFSRAFKRVIGQSPGACRRGQGGAGCSEEPGEGCVTPKDCGQPGRRD
jgi:AraC-like DNA-binding protein